MSKTTDNIENKDTKTKETVKTTKTAVASKTAGKNAAAVKSTAGTKTGGAAGVVKGAAAGKTASPVAKTATVRKTTAAASSTTPKTAAAPAKPATTTARTAAAPAKPAATTRTAAVTAKPASTTARTAATVTKTSAEPVVKTTSVRRTTTTASAAAPKTPAAPAKTAATTTRSATASSTTPKTATAPAKPAATTTRTTAAPATTAASLTAGRTLSSTGKTSATTASTSVTKTSTATRTSVLSGTTATSARTSTTTGIMTSGRTSATPLSTSTYSKTSEESNSYVTGSGFDFNYNDEKQDTDKKNDSKKKKIIIGAISAFVIILIIVICLCAKGCSSNSSRSNIYNLAQTYAEQGEYDRALSVLDKILLKDSEDPRALEMLQQIIEMKKAAEEGRAVPGFTNVNINTDGIADAMQDSMSQVKDALAQSNRQAEENRKTMENLVRMQEEQAAAEKQRQEALAAEAEERRLAEAAAEAQKKAAEEKRRAAEEELARKNAKVKKEMDAVNNEIQLGKTALATGNIEEALQHFNKAGSNIPVIEGDPNYGAKKKSEMAQALWEASEKAENPADKKRLRDEAISLARTVLKENPNDAPAQYILAQESMGKKDYNLALNQLKGAVQSADKDDPNLYLYYYDLGKLQYLAKRYTEAVASFTTSCELNGVFVPSRYNLGLSQVKLKNDTSAIAAFRKCIDINPRYEKAYLEEARALARRNDYSGAISAYESVIALNNINTTAITELGNVYKNAGRLAKAEESFRKALTMLSSSEEQTKTKYNLSTVLYDEGKTIDAEKYAKEAYDEKSFIADTKNRANIVYNYAMILDKNGKQNLAIPYYQEVLDLNPDHNKTKINLAVMYMNLEPPAVDTALGLLKQVYEADRSNFEANNNLGSAYLLKEDYKNAIMYYQNAIKIDSSVNDVRANLAKAYAKDGDYDNAKTTYNELIKLDSQNWDAYIELAKVCMQLNDNSTAEKWLVYVQTKNPSYRKNEVEKLLSSIE